MMAIPLATFLLAKLPACTKLTASLLMTPTNEPPLSVATSPPSYTLLDTVVPVTVNDLGVTLTVPGVL